MKKVNESLQQQLVLARQTRLPLTELGTTSRSAASSFVAAMEHQQKLNQYVVLCLYKCTKLVAVNLRLLLKI